jgi:hypothetical protein
MPGGTHGSIGESPIAARDRSRVARVAPVGEIPRSQAAAIGSVQGRRCGALCRHRAGRRRAQLGRPKSVFLGSGGCRRRSALIDLCSLRGLRKSGASAARVARRLVSRAPRPYAAGIPMPCVDHPVDGVPSAGRRRVAGVATDSASSSPARCNRDLRAFVSIGG